MDEETYQTLVRDIEKYHDKYKLKEGKLIKIKSDKELKILKRNEIVVLLTETSRGNKYIVVAIDYFTKYPEARALTNANAKSVAKFIYEDIICRHGCPRKII